MAATTERQTIFLTGATGAMGLAITKAMTQAGHAVLGVSRTPEGDGALRALHATPVEVDLFDSAAVSAAVRGADVIAHFATKIPEGMAATKPANWAMNDRLRTEGTRNLIAAAKAHGVRRFIFESFHGAYPDNGDAWIDESLPLRPMAPVMQSLIEGESLVNEFSTEGGEGVSLRFARIYGEGRASRSLVDLFRQRQMPIVGAGRNYISSIHVDDIGSALVAALAVAPGVYNVGDDEPMRQSDCIRLIAATLGAPSPRRFPYFAVRLMMGRLAGWLVASQRISNRRFREATGWRPRYASAREGWAAVAQVETGKAPELATVGAG